MHQPDNPEITEAQKQRAVQLLVYAITNKDFRTGLEDAVSKASQTPGIQGEIALRNELKELFKPKFPDVEFSHILAVSFDYADRETVGYDHRWHEKLVEHQSGKKSLAEMWKEECRVISAHAGGIIN